MRAFFAIACLGLSTILSGTGCDDHHHYRRRHDDHHHHHHRHDYHRHHHHRHSSLDRHVDTTDTRVSQSVVVSETSAG